MSNKKRRYDLPPIMINEIAQFAIDAGTEIAKSIYEKDGIDISALDISLDDAIIKAVEGLRQDIVKGFLYKLTLPEAEAFLATPPKMAYKEADRKLYVYNVWGLPQENADSLIQLSALYKLPPDNPYADKGIGDVKRAYNELKDLLTRHPELMPTRKKRLKQPDKRRPKVYSSTNIEYPLAKIINELPEKSHEALSELGEKERVQVQQGQRELSIVFEYPEKGKTNPTKEIITLTLTNECIERGADLPIPREFGSVLAAAYSVYNDNMPRGNATFTARSVMQKMGFGDNIRNATIDLKSIEEMLIFACKLQYTQVVYTDNTEYDENDKNSPKRIKTEYGGASKHPLLADYKMETYTMADGETKQQEAVFEWLDNETPSPIYDYLKEKHQLMTANISYIASPYKTSLTQQLIAMYLHREIQRMIETAVYSFIGIEHTFPRDSRDILWQKLFINGNVPTDKPSRDTADGKIQYTKNAKARIRAKKATQQVLDGFTIDPHADIDNYLKLLRAGTPDNELPALTVQGKMIPPLIQGYDAKSKPDRVTIQLLPPEIYLHLGIVQIPQDKLDAPKKRKSTRKKK